MRRRMIMAAMVCCFGILECLCAGKVESKVLGAEPQVAEVQVVADVIEIVQNTQEPASVAVETAVGETQNAAEDVKAEEEESEYANLAITDVSDYVNVRTQPNTDSEIVGKIYDGAVAQILATAGVENDWFQITSGNVEGYIKSEFFLYGDAAAEVIAEYVTVQEEFIYAKTL